MDKITLDIQKGKDGRGLKTRIYYIKKLKIEPKSTHHGYKILPLN